jgi:hypothetical protein
MPPIERQVAAGQDKPAARRGLVDVAGVTVGAAFVATLASTIVTSDLLRLLCQDGASFSIISDDLRAPKVIPQSRGAETIAPASTQAGQVTVGERGRLRMQRSGTANPSATCRRMTVLVRSYTIAAGTRRSGRMRAAPFRLFANSRPVLPAVSRGMRSSAAADNLRPTATRPAGQPPEPPPGAR